MRTTKIRTILDLFDRVYDFTPFKPKGHRVYNGTRHHSAKGFRT